MKIEQQRILDMGIGAGGTYIRKDGSGAIRVGVDLRTKPLTRARKRYGVEGLKIDAFVTNERGLPFADNSFDAIELKFPHKTLLYALASSHVPLWQEFRRVVKPQGHVQIVFDVPPEGYRVAETPGFSTKVYQPENVLWKNATDNRFTVEVRRVDSDFLRQMGTQFSNTVAGRMRDDPGYAAYELVAKPILSKT